MKLKVGHPPNYDAICEKIGTPPANALFTYGDTCFVPKGIVMEPGLEVHETMHMKQQELFGVEAWWARYLEDREFRFLQEVEAYQRQYLVYRKHLPRKVHRDLLRGLSKALCSPMYGKLCSRQLAEKLIAGKP